MIYNHSKFYLSNIICKFKGREISTDYHQDVILFSTKIHLKKSFITSDMNNRTKLQESIKQARTPIK
jgi:hypothetical protein